MEGCFYEPNIISRLAGEVISEGLAGCPKGVQVGSWSLVLTPEFMQTVEFFLKKSSISYPFVWQKRDITVKSLDTLSQGSGMESLSS